MDTVSPVLADAFHLLLRDLYAHLCEAHLCEDGVSGEQDRRVVWRGHRLGPQADP
ncbi:MAG: hypothetical protein ACRDSZ_19480 [Pseudonocardiaceae bacterium]